MENIIKTKSTVVPKVVYIDMDDVLCDFSGAYKRAVQANPGIRFPQSQYGFFQKLEPIEGAIDALSELNDSCHYLPYILTAPSTLNPLSYTEKRVWVEEKLGYGFVDRLIICSNKALLRGDILIDDNEKGKGQERFEGRLIHFGTPMFPNWVSIRNELQF